MQLRCTIYDKFAAAARIAITDMQWVGRPAPLSAVYNIRRENELRALDSVTSTSVDCRLLIEFELHEAP